MRKASGEGNNYKGFTNKQSTTFAGRIINKVANNGFMMEQKEGDNYVLPNEVYNFKIGEVNALGEGEPAIITVIGKKPKPQVCTDTAAVANSAWIGKAALCSKCGKNEVQIRSKDNSVNNYYPYVDAVQCAVIPLPGNNAIWTKGKNSYTVNHKVADITCGNKSETYHLIGGYVTWWEAVEVCEKLDLNMPFNRDSLLKDGMCGNNTRWKLLNVAFSISSNTTWVWTKEDAGENTYSYSVYLKSGEEVRGNRRYYSGARHALFGPKI